MVMYCGFENIFEVNVVAYFKVSGQLHEGSREPTEHLPRGWFSNLAPSEWERGMELVNRDVETQRFMCVCVCVCVCVCKTRFFPPFES
jgi:hypothetical protein